MSKDKKKQKEPEYNVELIKRIQPHGGISFKDDLYVKTGDGYEACLHIMEYPQEMDDHWLAPLTNIKGTVVTVDISTDDAEEVKKNLNRSMTEQNQRYRSASSYVDEEDAETKFQLMDMLMKEISRMNEVVKIVDTRIFVADRTWIGLEEKIKEIKTKLDNQGYKAYINLNETKDDWMSMNNTYREQQKSREAVEGQSYTSNSLAGGYPFHFSQLEDFVKDLELYTCNDTTQENFNKLLLEKDESLVYACLSLRPKSMEELLKKTGFEMPQMADVLQRLIQKDFITESFKNYYIRKI